MLKYYHSYCDFVGELTAGLYGHSHPLIQESLVNTVKNVGFNLGSAIAQEAVHARRRVSWIGLLFVWRVF